MNIILIPIAVLSIISGAFYSKSIIETKPKVTREEFIEGCTKHKDIQECQYEYSKYLTKV